MLLATSWREAVYVSKDNGQNWKLLSEGLEKSKQADEFNQPHFTKIVAAGDGAFLLAGFAALYRSEDGGESWHRIEISLGNAVSLDISSVSGSSFTLALSTYGSGVLLSDDQGQSWSFANKRLWNPRRNAIAFSPGDIDDRRLFSGTYGGIATAEGAAEVWRGVDLGRLEDLQGAYLAPTPQSIAISPNFQRDQTLFVGMYPHGMLRSVDGGRTYSLIWQGSSPTRSLAISPG
ncbi:MAG: hypothetical protein GKS02_10945, partial [Alphaproteobacteria bacterium]|nr:hypothetical protein [Alphaproteobacteria bacterium]